MIDIARTPYVISGVVKDVDGSTAVSGATVLVIDVTLGEKTTGTTGTDGSFSVDIANLTSAYSDADALQVVIYNSAKTKSTEFRHTVDTGQAGYDASTIYLHWTEPVLGDATVISGVLSNKSGGALTVDLYDRDNDAKKITCDVPAGNTIPLNFLFKGVKFSGGVCIIRESDAVNSLEVQLVVK